MSNDDVCSCGDGDTLGDVDPRCPVHFPSLVQKPWDDLSDNPPPPNSFNDGQASGPGRRVPIRVLPDPSISAELLTALKELREWSRSEYQNNPRIDAQVDAVIAKAESAEPQAHLGNYKKDQYCPTCGVYGAGILGGHTFVDYLQVWVCKSCKRMWH